MRNSRENTRKNNNTKNQLFTKSTRLALLVIKIHQKLTTKMSNF